MSTQSISSNSQYLIPVESKNRVTLAISKSLQLKFNDTDTAEVQQGKSLSALRNSFQTNRQQTTSLVNDLPHPMRCSLLFYAIQSGDRTLSLELRNLRIDLNTYDDEGNTPAHFGALRGDISLIKESFKYIDVNVKNKKGETPLHAASKAEQIEVIRFLIEIGANRDEHLAYQNIEMTPLLYAVVLGKTKSVQEFCKDQINTHSNENLFHVAVKFQQNEVLYELLQLFQKKPDLLTYYLEGKDTDGNTPFAHAVLAKNPYALCILHAFGASIVPRDRLGRTPLHLAAMQNDRHLIEYLYFLGCELDAYDNHHRKPLELATGSERAFLNNLELKDKSGKWQKMPFNLGFQGGGPKGLAYLSAIRVLAKRGGLRNVIRCAGTSAGAITSALLSINYNLPKLEEIIGGTDFKSFLDFCVDPKLEKELQTLLANLDKPKAIENFAKGQIYKFSGLFSYLRGHSTSQTLEQTFPFLWKCEGVCKGEKFRLWMEELIEAQTKIKYCTLGELRRLIQEGAPFHHLHIFATQLGTQPKIYHFSSEDPACDDFIISDCVRASMSIPIAFISHTMHKKIKGERCPDVELGQFVDGGLTYNFPIDAFDLKKFQTQGLPKEEQIKELRNSRTLGFSLYSPPQKEETRPPKFENISDFVLSITNVFNNAELLIRERNANKNLDRNIQIDNQGVGLLEFDLSKEKKEKLFRSGEEAAEAFFEKRGVLVEEISIVYHLPRVLKVIRHALCLPETHPHFVGRSSYLKKLEDQFFPPRLPAKHGIHLLYGPRGIGKTELAIAFANEHLFDCCLLWTISCKNAQSKQESYLALAKAQQVEIKPEAALEEIISRVHTHLVKLAEETKKPCLLIFENSQTLPTLPENGCISIMTGYSKIAGIASSEVFPLTKEEGLELLERITGAKFPLSKELVEFSGNYPNLLEQIGNQLKNIPGFTKITNLRELSQQFTPFSLIPSERYPFTIKELFDFTVSRLSPVSLKWLSVCSLLDHKMISYSFFEAWQKRTVTNRSDILVRKTNPNSLVASDFADASLRELPFFRFDPETDSFSYHPLLKSLLNFNPDTQMIQEAAELLAFMTRECTLNHTQKYAQAIKKLLNWASHFESLSQVTKFDNLNTADQAAIFETIGTYHYLKRHFDTSLKYHQKCHEIRKEMKNCAIDITQSVECIADCYFSLRMFKEARKHQFDAYNRRCSLLGMRDILTIKSLNKLALCETELENYPEALSRFEQAIKFTKSAHGENHPELVKIYNSQGRYFYKQKKFDDAIKMYQKASDLIKEEGIDIYLDYFQETVNNIGDYFFYQKKELVYSGMFHLAALKIEEILFGEEDPEIKKLFEHFCKQHDTSVEEYIKKMKSESYLTAAKSIMGSGLTALLIIILL